MNDVERIAEGLTEAQREAIISGSVQVKDPLPWCDCDFRAHGNWSWCASYGEQCSGLAVRAYLLGEK